MSLSIHLRIQLKVGLELPCIMLGLVERVVKMVSPRSLSNIIFTVEY